MAVIGQAVWAAALLERSLKVELEALIEDGKGTGTPISPQSLPRRASAGVLLRRLEELGGSPDLCLMTREIINRRNRLIHCVLEEYLPAIEDGGNSALEAAIDEITWFSYDCANCVAEFAARWLVAARRLEAEEA